MTSRRQVHKSGLDVLPEEDDESGNNVDANNANVAPQRKMSENKLLQTDITYGKANKRIQVTSPVWPVKSCQMFVKVAQK